MDIKNISELIDLIDNTSIAEIEIREGENSVRITRQSSTPVSTVTHVAAQPTTVAPVASHATSHHHPAEPPLPAAVTEPLGHAVRSPMVGTVYLAPAPGAKSFVEIGQTVKIGDVLCIVEAMKMMNQIESDKNGIVKVCLVENGLAVEFDQPLFIIE